MLVGTLRLARQVGADAASRSGRRRASARGSCCRSNRALDRPARRRPAASGPGGTSSPASGAAAAAGGTDVRTSDRCASRSASPCGRRRRDADRADRARRSRIRRRRPAASRESRSRRSCRGSATHAEPLSCWPLQSRYGKCVVGGDVIELRRRLVEPGAPRRAAVQRDDGALIGDGDDDVRVVGVDPRTLVVLAAGRALERRPRRAAVDGLARDDVGDDHRSRDTSVTTTSSRFGRRADCRRGCRWSACVQRLAAIVGSIERRRRPARRRAGRHQPPRRSRRAAADRSARS